MYLDRTYPEIEAVAERRPGSVRRSSVIFADLAVITTFAAVFVLFTVSPITLEAFGIEYIFSGGGLLSKLHPATFLVAAAIVFRTLAMRNPVRHGLRLLTDDAGVVLLLSAVVVALSVAMFVTKTPLTPLIDTFVLPIIFFLLLRDLDAGMMKWLALLLLVVLFANAIIGLLEFLRGFHLFQIRALPGTTFDPTRGDVVFDIRSALSSDWRATALFGHPLSNGLITGCSILCLLAAGCRWISPLVRYPMAALLFASMFAFGARTALVLMIVFSTFLTLQNVIEAIASGSRLTPRGIAFGLTAVGLMVVATVVAAHAGFLDKTIDRFTQDGGSAATRITMFSLFDPLTLDAIVLGPDQDLVATLQRLYGLEFGIESSWIGLTLTYGFVVTSIVMAALLAFSRSLMRVCGRGTIVILVFYFVLASVSASLSGKTTTMAMTVVLLLAFLRRDQRCLPPWPAARVNLV